MTSAPLRLGIAGVGRAFERLYRPALARVPAVGLVAACDPRGPGGPLPKGVAFFASLDEMLAAGGLGAVALLTPPRLHAAHASLALEAGLRVLVEKPVAMDLSELRTVLAAGVDLAPAFPRRYWPAYRGLSPDLRRLHLQTNPAEWAAHTQIAEHPAFDLLPHLADLACMAKGAAPVSAAATSTGSTADAVLRFADGSTVRCQASHADAYREWSDTGAGPRRVGPPGFAESLKQRARRRLPVDVRGMIELLNVWVGGEAAAPGAVDAWNSVAVVDAFWASVGSGREEPVEPWPGPGAVSPGDVAPQAGR